MVKNKIMSEMAIVIPNHKDAGLDHPYSDLHAPTVHLRQRGTGRVGHNESISHPLGNFVINSNHSFGKPATEVMTG